MKNQHFHLQCLVLNKKRSIFIWLSFRKQHNIGANVMNPKQNTAGVRMGISITLTILISRM